MLNSEQQEIVNSTEHKILINSGCGTGKTTTIAAAAMQHKDKNVALITFTNKAAEEIQSRLDFTPAFVGTIHMFAYYILQELSDRYQFRLNILRGKQQETLIRGLLSYKNYDYNIISKYCKYTENKDYFRLNEQIEDQMFEIDKIYSKYKKKVGLYDMTDTPEYLVQKLKQYDPSIDIDYIFVDEAQDLSPEQYELINIINIPYKILIGDPKQSIYLFRGADGFVFDKAIEDGYKEYRMIINYRSYQDILDFAGSPELQSIRGYGGILYKNCNDILDESPKILCRSNNEVKTLKKYYSNICTIHAAKGLEFDNVLLVDFEILSAEDLNIKYVALTRAKNGLGIFDLKTVVNNLKNKNFFDKI